ncbi:MAG TPA: T9SS type A sorting domain-containing protein, partial [Flavobacteriales bacterium]|nr:T9SS type A sorting domain-containing protein [Flavobacteriales bacterium]
FQIRHLLVLCFILTTVWAKSQFSCTSPLLVTNSTFYSAWMDTSVINTDTTNDYGCLTNTDNPLWLYFKACNNGDATFNMNILTGSSSDANIVVWGPLASPGTCPLTPGDVFWCSDTVMASQTFTLSGLTGGAYYKILITNYEDSTAYLTFDCYGGSAYIDTACPPPPGCGMWYQDICMVTTDPVLNKNIIIWNKDTTMPILNYVIEKETTTMGVYDTVEVVALTDTSAQIDSVTNPMIHANIYHISVTDTCGYTLWGADHQTMHLATSTSILGYPQLNWNPYIGFSYGTFFISRGTSPATLALYDSLAASSYAYTDYAPVSGMNYYMVSVQPPAPCTPTRAAITLVSSNVAYAEFVGVSENPSDNFTIYPNPANTILNFETHDGNEITLSLLSVEGKTVLNKSFSHVTHGSIDVSAVANGTYVVMFRSIKGIGYSKVTIAR